MTGLGIAGLGWLGESLINAARTMPDLEVVAVQDIRAQHARTVAAACGAAWWGERFDDLLQVDGVEAVAICTPNALHAGQVQAALQAGKDVLVQKPLALSGAEAAQSIDLAARLQRLLFVDYSYRFLETVRAMPAALAELGRVRSAKATFHNVYGPGAEKAWFFDPKLSGGGALIDLGVHLLDMGLWLLPSAEPRLEAATCVWPDGQDKVEYAAHVSVDLGDLPFDIDVSWNAPLAATEISFDVQAERGAVRWENVDGSFFGFRTLRNEQLLIERETTLREDTLQAFVAALASRRAPTVDARVYALLDQAYHHARQANSS